MTKNRCIVSVKNKDNGFIHMTYRCINNIELLLSPYISWDNLNFCAGWNADMNYLLTAVQNETKLCAGIVFNFEEELFNNHNNFSDEYKFFL